MDQLLSRYTGPGIAIKSSNADIRAVLRHCEMGGPGFWMLGGCQFKGPSHPDGPLCMELWSDNELVVGSYANVTTQFPMRLPV